MSLDCPMAHACYRNDELHKLMRQVGDVGYCFCYDGEEWWMMLISDDNSKRHMTQRGTAEEVIASCVRHLRSLT